jgi:membrane protease YdiL (CAAX protease family)
MTGFTGSGQINPADQALDGSWERAHRNVTVAAFVGLLVVGVIYFNAQSLMAGVWIAVDAARKHEALGGRTFIEQLVHTAKIMKTPMRYSLVLSQFLFMLVPTLWIVKRWHTSHVFSYVRLVRVSAAEVFFAVAATLCFIPVGGLIGDFLRRQLDIPDFLSRINAEIFTSYSTPELVWLVIVVCVTPAVCEETLFRGYVQRTMERTIGAKAVITVGIIFGLYHMQPLNLITLSLLGMLLGYFSYRSKSLFPSMAAHFTNNCIAVFAMYRTADDRPVFDVFSGELTLPLAAVAMLATGGFLGFYHFATRKNFSGGK